MSRPSSSIRPVTRAPGVRSCIRFRHRRKVDFPEPEAPTRAVICRAGISRSRFLTAATAPKKAEKPRAQSFGTSPALALGAPVVTVLWMDCRNSVKKIKDPGRFLKAPGTLRFGDTGKAFLCTLRAMWLDRAVKWLLPREAHFFDLLERGSASVLRSGD